MNHLALPITTIDPRTADDRTMLAIADLNLRHQRQSLPEEPQMGREALAQIYRAVPDFNNVRDWLIWDGGILAGLAFAIVNSQAEDERTLAFNIIIDPDYRRKGLSRALLAKVYDFARENRRAFLTCELIDRDVAGNIFMERIGGKAALHGKINQLDLQELDRGLIQRWIEQAKERAGGYTLGIWENQYPEEDLPALAEVLNEINRTAPHDDLEHTESSVTPENVREIQKMFQDQGACLWTAYVRELASGRVVGISEVVWHPDQPAILNQLATVVLERCRNQGLGRWLKAAVLERVLTGLPQVRYVRTHNANSNAPMLKINQELGFKPYFSHIVWQVSIERVKEYLEYR